MKLTEITTIQAQLAHGKKAQCATLAGSSDALFFAQLASQMNKPIVIFCADPQQAWRLLNEIKLFDEHLKVHHFPDWETLPYDTFSPHHDLISERLKTLQALLNNDIDVLTLPISSALYRLAPTDFVRSRSFYFKKGDQLDEHALRHQLVMANHHHVNQVAAPGEFSVRGSLIDIFPMGSKQAFRIDLFDDEIDNIHTIDIDTQRSLNPVTEIDLLPGREFPMDEEARQRFRTQFRENIEGDPSQYAIYKDMGNGIASAGIEYYLPLFFENLHTLFDYLHPEAICCLHGEIKTSIEQFTQETQKTYNFIKAAHERPVLEPKLLFINEVEFFTQLKNFSQLSFTKELSKESIPVPDVSVHSRSPDPFEKLKALKQRVLICADSLGRRETIWQILRENQLNPEIHTDIESFVQSNDRFGLCHAQLYSGFILVHEEICFLTENDLYPSTRNRQIRKGSQSTNIDAMIRDLAELHAGDPVVHIQYGIGRYLGLVNMDNENGEEEMLHLQYANDSTLYIPVSQLHVISRYSGTDPDAAPLHKLGSDQWEKAKKKAAQQAHDTAAELLNLYARRHVRQGTCFKIPMSDYHEFAQGFGFEETPDQSAAIEAVLQDMSQGKAMDRLVCGDVGFGKTEVALRAAFVCAANGQQVAILCPTTLLAEQHAKTFQDRFSSWPITVAELSRFRTSKEVKATLEGLQKGTVDIVIGTHKLVSKDVHFKNLGLVIIDEEHRFGVRQKEALKALRAEVDVLTLTATPIPRTLGMSLEGLRDFSIIATAPQKRLAIKTFVRSENNSTIREAVMRELKRGGQVYFLHNEVETIENRKAHLEELIPEAKIAVAHGQMNERELEAVMKGFYQQRFNVLLCTTIIETGIDVPNANTIIIHRADKLGLAQLHQLRGRVGRSYHQAYAYMLIPSEEGITKNAKLRLDAIKNLEELGSGFYLAMNDLEIRGTGEILGESQSGNIQSVGYSLYTEMLNKAIISLKNGYEPDLENPFEQFCEVRLHTSTLIPEDYCPDVHTRLMMYKRLAHAQTEAELNHLQEELIDRFGLLPDAAKALFESHVIRILCQPLHLSKVDIGDTCAILTFSKQTTVNPAKVIMLIQQNKHIHLQGTDKLKIDFKEGLSLGQKVQIAIRDLLNKLLD